MEVCKWISEREEVKIYMDKNLTSIYIYLDNDPGNTNIPRLPSNITPLQTRIVELTDKIGLGYPAFESHTPLPNVKTYGAIDGSVDVKNVVTN